MLLEFMGLNLLQYSENLFLVMSFYIQEKINVCSTK